MDAELGSRLRVLIDQNFSCCCHPAVTSDCVVRRDRL